MAKIFKKRSFITAAMVLCMLIIAVPAMADMLYTAGSSMWMTDRLGLISGTNAPTKDINTAVSASGGSGVFPFYNESKSATRVAIAQNSYGASDTLWVFDPSTGSWSKPVAELSTVANVHDMTYSEKYLYAAGYDKGIIGSFAISGDTYTTGKSYTFTPSSSDYKAHAEGVAYYDSNVYGIFTAVKGSYGNYTYLPHKLVKLSQTLSVVSSADLNGKNFDGSTPGSHVIKGSTLYIASLGGNQSTTGSFNTDSMIEKVDLSTMKSTALVTTADLVKKDSTWKYNFYSMAINGETVYIEALYWGAWGSTTTNNIVIYKTTVSALEKGDIGTKIGTFTSDGYSVGLDFDSKTNLLWAATGDTLQKYDGSKWTPYDSTAMGGHLTKFHDLVAASAKSDSGSSGGGCNAGFAGLLLLAAIPAITFSRKKK